MITTQCYLRVIEKLFGEAMVIIYMVIEQQVDGEIDAQVGRGVWQGGAGALWSVGGGVTPLVYVIMLATVREADLLKTDEFLDALASLRSILSVTE